MDGESSRAKLATPMNRAPLKFRSSGNHRIMHRTLSAPQCSRPEHNEHTFRSLLELEHQRCRRSGQGFHVLLCRLSTQDGMRFPMSASVKRTLLSAVRDSLGRAGEVGWVLQDLVLGVLLLGMNPARSVSQTTETARIRRLIESRLAVAHPSSVLQFYDFLDLPPLENHAHDQTSAESYHGGHYAMYPLYRHTGT